MKVLLLGIVLSTTVIADMRTDVFEKLNEGDSKDKLVSVLGVPEILRDPHDADLVAMKAKIYDYFRDGDQCEFAVTKDNKILKMWCASASPTKPSSPGLPRQALGVVGTLLKGMGDGLAKGNNNTKTCFQFGAVITCE